MKLRLVLSHGLLLFVLVSLSVSGVTAQNSAPPSWLPTDAAAAERMAFGVLPHSLKDAPLATLTWAVDVTTDSVDANPGDSLCADASGDCSLRAAIMEANARAGFDIVTLPAGTFALTIAGAGEDAAAAGDLDITGADGVQISGHRNGTIIDGGDLDRVLDIVSSSAFVNDLTITNGSTSEFGGGLNVVGSLSLYNATVSGNTANTAGGGIASVGISGNLYINDSLIRDNNALSVAGGGVFILSGIASIHNSTISGNTTDSSGGGLATESGTATEIVNVTITDNSAASGGGMDILGQLWMGASILAGNTAAAAGPDCLTGIGYHIITMGYNLIGNDSSCFADFVIYDLVGTEASPIDPMLAPLADNGGFTHTHATLPGSPARDYVPLSASSSEDQRGVRRPQEGDYDGFVLGDIGAFEFALPFIPLSPLSGEHYIYNAVKFGWTAKPGETKYRLEVKAPGTSFAFNKNASAAKFCLGAVCEYTQFFVSIPNHKTLQWRVIANSTPTSTLPWRSFSTQIPGISQIIEPDEAGYVADTTPTLTWTDHLVADKFMLKLVNLNNGQVVTKFPLTANSTPSRYTACSNGLCTLATDEFGVTLVEGQDYSLVVEGRYRVGNTAQTKFVNYVSKSAKRTFNVIADPGLIALPAAPDLRSSGK